MAELTDIVQCRVEELFGVLIKNEITASGVTMLPAGMIITGGGSKSAGIDHYLSGIMNMPVRVSLPQDYGRMPPTRNGAEYTGAAGIIRYVLEQERDPLRYFDHSVEPIDKDTLIVDTRPADKGERGLGDFFQSIIKILKELF
jgi:cell division protein FtsA